MTSIDYRHAPAPVREDLVASRRRAWRRLALPGTWWTGRERVAIATETRHAPGCGPCREAAGSVSAIAADARHEAITRGVLPDTAVEAVHRVVNDAPRLSQSWYRGLLERGLDEGRYVELVGVVATTLVIDGFCDAFGMPRHRLPEPEPGEPARHRPRGARGGLAWVPTVAPEDVTDAEADLYDGLRGMHIHRALSLVPAEVRGLFDLDTTHYLPDARLREFDAALRALGNAQIELLAARVSTLNHCVY